LQHLARPHVPFYTCRGLGVVSAGLHRLVPLLSRFGSAVFLPSVLAVPKAPLRFEPSKRLPQGPLPDVLQSRSKDDSRRALLAGSRLAVAPCVSGRVALLSRFGSAVFLPSVLAVPKAPLGFEPGAVHPMAPGGVTRNDRDLRALSHVKR
jgi:hypothetical protein